VLRLPSAEPAAPEGFSSQQQHHLTSVETVVLFVLLLLSAEPTAPEGFCSV